MWLELLVRDLAGEGTVLVPGAGGLAMASFRGEPVDPPVTLALTDRQFAAHLQAMAPDAAEVFPDVDPVRAAYRLFLVHIDETVITRAAPGSRITLVDGRLRVEPERPADPLPDLDPDAEYEWRGEPPGGRRRPRT